MEKSTKNILIGVGVVAAIIVVGKNWSKWFPKTTTTTEPEASTGINGAQYLYEEGKLGASGEFSQGTGRCYCGQSNTPVEATSANDCQSKCAGQSYRFIPGGTMARRR